MLVLKRAQGEVFGIALFFVVLIIGIIIFATISSMSPDTEVDSFTQRQYSLLATDALNSIKKMSTECEIERGRNSVEDLMRYCFETARSVEDDPLVVCNGDERPACEYSLHLINESLHKFFGEDDALVVSIPFSLSFDAHFEHEVYSNTTLTNVEDFDMSLDRSDSDHYLRRGYVRENAGFDIISTRRREVEFVFDVYHR